MIDMLTKRGIAKFATRMIVSSAVANATATTINHVTDADPDSSNEAVEIGTTVVGMVVSFKLKPYTDQMIDRVADWHVARKHASDITE